MFPMATARGLVTPAGGYDKVDPYNMLGGRPAQLFGGGDGQAGSITALQPSMIDRKGEKPWHPDSPMFWFGILLATTLGLIGASTSIRVGPFKGSIAAGKS